MIISRWRLPAPQSHQSIRSRTIPADLMTPGDIGVTHIMTFTVSPTIDMNSGEQMGNDHDDENMDDTGFMDFGEDDLGLGEFGSIMEDVGASVEGMEHPGSIRNFRTGTIDLTPYDQPGRLLFWKKMLS